MSINCIAVASGDCKSGFGWLGWGEEESCDAIVRGGGWVKMDLKGRVGEGTILNPNTD